MIRDTLRKLDEQYDRGEVPEPGELSGEYRVVVPWFPWVSLSILKHRKRVGTGGEGDNLLATGLRFGHFRLKKEPGWLLIDYDLQENPGVMRRVKDRVRRLPDGRLVGKLFYRFPGREQFLMFFEMRASG
jgi:hypothetical protein